MKRPSSCLNFPTRANDWTIMQANTELTKEFLNSIFDYRDGCLFHKIRDESLFSRTNSFVYFNRHIANTKVKSHVRNDGYIGMVVCKKQMLFHRVVFIMFRGQIPDGIEIDHIDRDKINNKIENLRLSKKCENQRNRKTNSNSISGIKGVYFRPETGKYRAKIKKDGVLFSCQFDKIEDAKNWVRIKRTELHGEFANHGTT